VDKTSGGSVTRTVTYYPAAGAMRINSTLYYTLKDHLGSASVITDATGNILGENRYYPFGETRLSTGSILTDKLYTGQREITGLGIYHYQARFYSPKLGRFLSADTIVPGYANPQNLNRFSYVTNNPLRYIDPSGNIPIDCYGDASYCSNTTTLPDPPSGGNKPKKPKKEKDDEQPEGHYYELTNVVCPAAYNCTEEEMQEYATRFQYPGQSYLFPVEDGDLRFVFPSHQLAFRFRNPALLLTGAIRVRIGEDGLTLVNQTLPTHIFHDGRVEREYYQRENGTWVVTTTGTGTNVLPVVGPTVDQANNVVGASVFEQVDAQMLQYITLDQEVP